MGERADPTALWWHFLSDDGRMAYGKRGLVAVGTTYRIRSTPVLCGRGFHAAARPLDALNYAPGALVCRVRLGGLIVVGDDKVAAQERTVVWMADATRTLHEFACWAAEWILDRREAAGGTIDPRSRAAVVAKRRWLAGEITDQELAAAWDAAWDAARAAARAAAWAAAGAAARAAAWAAAGAAAWAAAGDAAWDAAGAAARAAAGAAARAAARAAAWAAAGAAAWDELNERLESMLLALAPPAPVEVC
jgi:hypothetical protein